MIKQRYGMITIIALVTFLVVAPGAVQCAAAQEAGRDGPGRETVQEHGPEEDQAEKKDGPRMLNTSGRTRLELNGFLGFGAGNPLVGITLSGEDIEISGGGGVGIGLTIGYGISSKLDLDITAGTQEGRLIPTVEDADGTFTRDFLLATIKFKVPLSSDAQLKFGVGAGSYRPGRLDLDLSAVGGNHRIVEYDDAAGFHLTGELEGHLGDSTFVVAGVKYYHVRYDAESYLLDGNPQPVSLLPDELRDFDGSGIDLTVGVGICF